MPHAKKLCPDGCGRECRTDATRCRECMYARQRTKAGVCVHCRKRAQQRFTRGLCLGCHRTPTIRDLYPSAHDAPPSEAADVRGGYDLPAEPTDAPVGSEARIAAYMARVEAGVALHHPKDAGGLSREAELALRAIVLAGGGGA